MEKQFNLLIDTKRTGFNTVRGLKQGDNNSVLNITLVQNSIPFDLTDLTVRINYKRPDSKIFLQMADIINPTEGKIKVNILTKALETTGEIKCDLSVFDKDNRKITSATFSMFVDASIYGNDYIEPEDLDLIQQIYSEEEKRIRQENGREINEKTRQSNENIRMENENVRKDSELERIKNEELRQENENIRVNKEDERITQENERVESETIRQAKEKERVENEETRQANEEKRQSDEITRQQNEENRKQTQLDMQKVITNINEIEPYETSKTYNKLNRVTYNGSSYEAVKDVPINTPPTNTMYWICIAEKGKDGRGSGNMHTDVYDKNNDGIVDVAETANNVDWSNIQNKPDLSQMSKVQSVNDKTGEVVLNAEDIKTNSGATVESHLAESAQQAHLAKNIGLEDIAGNFVATELEGALNELFTNVSDGKSLIAGAITDKGQNADPSDTFRQLADAILSISSIENFAVGEITRPSGYDGNVSIRGLDFKPTSAIYFLTSTFSRMILINKNRNINSYKSLWIRNGTIRQGDYTMGQYEAVGIEFDKGWYEQLGNKGTNGLVTFYNDGIEFNEDDLTVIGTSNTIGNRRYIIFGEGFGE